METACIAGSFRPCQSSATACQCEVACYTPPIQLHSIHIPQMAYWPPRVTQAPATTWYISDDGLSSSNRSMNGYGMGKALNRVESTHHMIWRGAWQGLQSLAARCESAEGEWPAQQRYIFRYRAELALMYASMRPGRRDEAVRSR